MKGIFVSGILGIPCYHSCNDKKNPRKGLKISAYSTMNRRFTH